MKFTKNVRKTYEIQYVDCTFVLENIKQCCINNSSCFAQTIKDLPFLRLDEGRFKWNPRIDLDKGVVIGWPKGVKAIIYFDLKYHICVYLNHNYEYVFSDTKQIPNYLQLDLIDKKECINFTINSDGTIANWPTVEEIIKELV